MKVCCSHPIFLTNLVFLLVTALLSAATARTWIVEKDGSGDFTVIQDAIDAASSGDTIRIGPGRFTDFRWYDYDTVHYNQVSSKSLVFDGAGKEETIIGHESFGFPDYINGAGFVIMGEVGGTRFSNIGFDMPALIGFGIYNGSGDQIEVEHCRFTRCNNGGVFSIAPGGGFVRDCEFEDIDVEMENTGIAVTLYTPVHGFVVSDCTFTNCFEGFGAFWGGCDGIVVENCTITGGRCGATFKDGASGIIRNCEIRGQDYLGILASSPGLLTVEDNVVSIIDGLQDSVAFLMSRPTGAAVLRNNVIESNTRCLVILYPYVDLDIHQNHILQVNDQGWFARVRTQPPYTGPPFHFDLSDNWWGTTDAAYVSQWIHDGHDDPDMNYFFDFEPMAGGPVSVQSRTWSQVKGMFRD